MRDKNRGHQHKPSDLQSEFRKLREQSAAFPTAQQDERMMAGIEVGLRDGATTDQATSPRTRRPRWTGQIGSWSAAAAAVVVVGAGAWVWQANQGGGPATGSTKGVGSSGVGTNTVAPHATALLPMQGGSGPLHMFGDSTGNGSSAGWAMTANGNVLETGNGQKWTPRVVLANTPAAQQQSGAAIDGQLPSVNSYFLSSLNLWITAPAKQSRQLDVLHSTDGGKTVQLESVITPHVSKLTLGQGSPDGVPYASVVAGQPEFINANDGWMVLSWMGELGMMGRTLYETTDGGAHWQVTNARINKVFSSSIRVQWITGVQFRTPEDGFMTGRMFPVVPGSADPTGLGMHLPLMHTNDSGKTWSSVPLPLPASYGKVVYGATYAPKFFGPDLQHGVLLAGVAYPKPRVIVFTTSDGGTHWHATPGFSADIAGLTHLSENTSQPVPVFDLFDMRHWFMASTDGATLYRTSDGGQTWQTLHPNISLKGAQLDFVSDQIGFALTPQGLWKTTDDGQTWTKVTSFDSATANGG